MRYVLLALALIGCVADRPLAPSVRLVAADNSELAAVYVEAARAWSPLGFDVALDDSGQVECGRHWYRDGETDCQITIGFVSDPQLRARRGTNAMTDRDARTVTIDASLTSYSALMYAVGHESGHVLLDTSEHTKGGIMGGDSWAMEQVDRDLACRVIGICI